MILKDFVLLIILASYFHFTLSFNTVFICRFSPIFFSPEKVLCMKFIWILKVRDNDETKNIFFALRFLFCLSFFYLCWLLKSFLYEKFCVKNQRQIFCFCSFAAGPNQQKTIATKTSLFLITTVSHCLSVIHSIWMHKHTPSRAPHRISNHKYVVWNKINVKTLQKFANNNHVKRTSLLWIILLLLSLVCIANCVCLFYFCYSVDLAICRHVF